ncbi:MAG: hypothetical protein M9924_05805 [Rhizobiaceae bacterium]|nr:hypothetical protein [Rhizobiaceae bacterium]
MKDARTNRRESFSAAIRRFPHFELAIRRLIKTDEVFREVCEELEEAELALSSTDREPAHLRDVRRVEWQALVDRLVGEIAAAIRADASARATRKAP